MDINTSTEAPMSSLLPAVHPKDITNTLCDQSDTTKDIKTLKEFKVSYADFINEKNGRIRDIYSILSPAIGEGSKAEIRRAVHKETNVIRAVKIIRKNKSDENQPKKLINEVNVLKGLDHPNIMKIFEFYQDDEAFYIVSEYYDGGELFYKIQSMGSFSEKEAAIIIKQVLLTINYCHKNKIVQRDIKPENLIFESKQDGTPIKLIDFDTSESFTPGTHLTKKLGTAYYIAPQVLRKDYTEKCDVWSCGVILYILLCGYPPFGGASDVDILEKIKIGRYRFDPEEWDCVSEEAKTFIRRMIEFDPDQRYSAEEALNDPWIELALGKPEVDTSLILSVLNNLKQFRTESKLQEVVWVFLVFYFSSKEEKNQLLSTFQFLDTDCNGIISREELVNGYHKIMGTAYTEVDIDAIMNSVDINGSGTINYTEFVIATINRRKLLSEERLESVFQLFDKNRDGYLTADDLREIFSPEKSKHVDERVWLEILKEVNQNEDEKVSYKDFKEMMLKLA